MTILLKAAKNIVYENGIESLYVIKELAKIISNDDTYEVFCNRLEKELDVNKIYSNRYLSREQVNKLSDLLTEFILDIRKQFPLYSRFKITYKIDRIMNIDKTIIYYNFKGLENDKYFINRLYKLRFDVYSSMNYKHEIILERSDDIHIYNKY